MLARFYLAGGAHPCFRSHLAGCLCRALYRARAGCQCALARQGHAPGRSQPLNTGIENTGLREGDTSMQVRNETRTRFSDEIRIISPIAYRSEERRVGKEPRSRAAP